jgi:hypothetical protein
MSSITYTIDPQKAHVRIVGTGDCTMPEMIKAVDRVAEDPAFVEEFSVILDLTGGNYTAELNDGDAFVTALKRRKDQFRGKFALAVPTWLLFLAKLYCVLAEVGGFARMKCFTSIEDASKWCNALD